MKQQVSSPLKAFLLSVPGNMTVADCLTFTTATGLVFRVTSFDSDVYLAGVKFDSMGSRLLRGQIQSKRGVETSSLEFTIAPDVSPDGAGGQLATPPSQAYGMSLTQAAVAGLLYGATARLETVYNPVRQADGSYTDNGWGSLIKFVGEVADIEAHKDVSIVNAVSLIHKLEPMWPPYLIQPQCRWRLFDNGCRLNPLNFQVNGSALAGSTKSEIQHGLTNPSGYFSGGTVQFTSGANSGLTRGIRIATGSGANVNYATTVLNDKPQLYLKLNNANDSSGNGYNATINGGVTFGHASLLNGDTGVAATFDGSTGYLSVPVPKPTKAEMGVTFEFWYTLSAGASATQPQGIFDTNPIHGASYALRNNGEKKDTLPGFEWWRDKPYLPFQAPTPGTVQHIVVVFRGAQVIDLYIDGLIYDSQTKSGVGGMGNWAANMNVGRTADTYGGTFEFFDGVLQHFAIYPYPFSPNQALTHYIAGSTAPSVNGNGVLELLTPFPYAPATGDTFTVLPGCDKSMTVCIATFNNLINFGGQTFVPPPESAT